MKKGWFLLIGLIVGSTITFVAMRYTQIKSEPYRIMTEIINAIPKEDPVKHIHSLNMMHRYLMSRVSANVDKLPSQEALDSLKILSREDENDDFGILVQNAQANLTVHKKSPS